MLLRCVISIKIKGETALIQPYSICLDLLHNAVGISVEAIRPRVVCKRWGGKRNGCEECQKMVVVRNP